MRKRTLFLAAGAGLAALSLTVGSALAQCHVAYVDHAAGLGFSCQMLIVAGARCRVLAGSPSFLTR
jgi:hypothetical protein